jgi:ribosomal protein S21
VVYIIAKHEATERQQQIAEMRARQSYAGMSAKRKANMKAKKVRYIAVDTERGQKSSPKAKKTVILLGADKAGVGLFKNLAPHLVHAAASPEEAVSLIGDLL